MRRTLALVAVVAAALAGSSAGAQSIPNITAAKSAATNAANAANAHTAAVNGTASEKPAASKPAAQPAKAQPAKPQPAKAQSEKAQPASAKPETKPAASKPDAKAAKPDAKAAKPEAKPAPVVEKPDPKAGRSVDSVQTIKVGASTNVATRGAASELTFSREIYSYPGRGRRDPFMSLLKSGDLRPLLSDLKLVTVLYDPTGRNSVAILRDLSTKDQYRVKVGQQLGRMRVAQIQPKQLVLTIEEFGYNRQELLALTSDSTRTR